MKSIQHNRIILSLLHGKPEYWALLIVLVAFMWANNRNKFWEDPNRVIMHDVNMYYAYFPAVFIYHDLSFNFKDDHPEINPKIWVGKSENGRHVNKMSIGMSVMYTPILLPIHWLAKPLGFQPNGYSEIYRFGLVMSGLIYAMLGLYLLARFLRRYFKGWPVAITILILGLGTNLFFYTTSEPAMTHSHNLFLFAAFVMVVDEWVKRPGTGSSVLMGLITGLIFLVRPTNLVVLVIIPLWGVTSLKDLMLRFRFFGKHLYHIFLTIVAAALVALPQFLFWKYSSGSFFYYGYGEEGFFFSDPAFLEGLFSYRKGWLIYTPVMIFSLAGFYFLYRQQRGFFWPIISFTVINMYVVFSWWCWWYGGGFGQRALIESYVLLAIPLTAFNTWITKAGLKAYIAYLPVILFLIFLNIFQSRQYYYGSIHWDSMSKEAYWDSFLRLRPSDDFQQLLDPPDYQSALKGDR